ncbi:hypothetical protein M124_1781 [Bacteroides fragilis str. 3988T(B)14]|uniref:Uncharacterized protein n=1 Tax=Bacteroides fragilis str. 3988T(B)14 TaxID=1339315 RepID=A0A015SW43_BACFG|nr:hypothetical protein M124_1781 [Bacteroides fragilis str. 3988T(B)14]EXZ50170.1 hypothetical protein M109_0783 [Bacteroides fragilis str. 3397 N2]EYA43557.1 hypothetical protein M110_2023 [Bacteroides fragilis str. 3397 N3]
MALFCITEETLKQKKWGVALSLRCFTMVGKVVLPFQFNFKI